jgi:ribosomal protein S14
MTQRKPKAKAKLAPVETPGVAAKKTVEDPRSKHAGGRPPIFTCAAEMQSAIDGYYATCEEKGRPWTVMGLALALGMCRDTLQEYAKHGEFSVTVKKARDLVVERVEQMILTGGGAGPIFWMKNNGGYVDKQEINANVATAQATGEAGDRVIAMCLGDENKKS